MPRLEFASTRVAEPTRVLVLWADDESPNLGVRVLARGTAELVRSVWPDAEITFHNYGSRRPELPIGRLRSLLWERVRGAKGMQNWLRSFDVAIDTRSGDSFTDSYGLHRLATMSAVGIFASQTGTPVVLGPQTIGPFRTRRGRALARASLRSASFALARDSASAAVSSSLGFPLRPATTDVVFSLPVPLVATTRDVILNVSGLLWQPNPHVDSASYRDLLLRLAIRLRAEGRLVCLLAHVVRSGNDDSDVAAANELAAAIEEADQAGSVQVIVPEGLDDVRRVLASARVVIGSRMHACLNALSVGVPAVALAYSDKFVPLMHDLGWTHTVDLRDGADALEGVITQLASAEAHDTAMLRKEAQIARHEGELALAHLRLSRASRP
jgi:colanic acid/amylovoran biosynthesis protein